MELTLIVIIIWIGSTCFHEFGHAITAYFAGDKTVKEKGYLTLNPMVYFNSVTTLAIPLVVLLIGGVPLPGAAVYINHKEIKSKLWLSIVSFAGPLFTFFVLVALAFLTHVLNISDTPFLSGHWRATLLTSFAFLVFLHIFVLILNLLPLPPLDGYGIIEPWLPESTQKTIRKNSNIGFAFLFFLFFLVDDFSIFMTTLSVDISQKLGLTKSEIFLGYDVFKDHSMPLAVLLIVAWIVKNIFAGPIEKADRLIREGKWEEAAKLYDQGMSKLGDRVDNRVLLAAATCQLNMGQTHEAESLINRVLASDPKDARAITLKGISLVRQGLMEETIATLDALPEGDSDELALAYQVKGGALMSRDRFEEALPTLEKALAINARNDDATYLKAQCLEELGRYEEALGVYQKLTDSRQYRPQALVSRGMLFLCLDRLDEAKKEFGRILPMDPAKRAPELATLHTLIAEKADLLGKAGRQEMSASLLNHKNQIE